MFSQLKIELRDELKDQPRNKGKHVTQFTFPGRAYCVSCSYNSQTVKVKTRRLSVHNVNPEESATFASKLQPHHSQKLSVFNKT